MRFWWWNQWGSYVLPEIGQQVGVARVARTQAGTARQQATKSGTARGMSGVLVRVNAPWDDGIGWDEGLWNYNQRAQGSGKGTSR